ncbi:hypothetical protein KAI32_00065 [Candidatus Pacearchaeota archaeon]|nr:hypothetical protein [Candidatus Pacearchaeota archaeon]
MTQNDYADLEGKKFELSKFRNCEEFMLKEDAELNFFWNYLVGGELLKKYTKYVFEKEKKAIGININLYERNHSELKVLSLDGLKDKCILYEDSFLDDEFHIIGKIPEINVSEVDISNIKLPSYDMFNGVNKIINGVNKIIKKFSF